MMSARRLAFGVFAVFTVIVGALLLEIAVRQVAPRPPFQVVRHGAQPGRSPIQLRSLDGIPVWTFEDDLPRWRSHCDAANPNAMRIAFFGSSITHGSGVEIDQAFPAVLERLLDERTDKRAHCVINFGEPGYELRAKIALALEWIPRMQPDLVLWELWDNDLHEFTMVGQRAYSWRGVPIDEHGYPEVLGLVPRPIHRALFMHSLAWERLSLVLANRQRRPIPSRPLAERAALRTLEFMDELRRQDIGVALVAAPHLDRPFRESAGESRSIFLRTILPMAAEARVPVFDIASQLSALDPVELRRDPCCHYNVRGHEEIGRALHHWLTVEQSTLLEIASQRGARPPSDGVR